MRRLVFGAVTARRVPLLLALLPPLLTVWRQFPRVSRGNIPSILVATGTSDRADGLRPDYVRRA
jgi:hypothetical protein